MLHGAQIPSACRAIVPPEEDAQMSKYVLSHDVYVCKVDDAAVFLDLRSNQYLAVPPDAMAALDQVVEGFCTLGVGIPRSDSGYCSAGLTIESLVSRGILTESRQDGVPARRAVISASQAIAPGEPSNTVRAVRCSHLAHFVAALASALFSVHLHRLN